VVVSAVFFAPRSRRARTSGPINERTAEINLREGHDVILNATICELRLLGSPQQRGKALPSGNLGALPALKMVGRCPSDRGLSWTSSASAPALKWQLAQMLRPSGADLLIPERSLPN